MQRALTHLTEHNGEKPVHTPYAANDLAISKTEERIGFKLPEGLKRLYRIKDGGSTKSIRVARVLDPRPVYDDWESAFGGYEDLCELEKLCTVHDRILDYAEEDDEESFPEGAKEMLILSQWHQQSTFLDYRNGCEPRLGIAYFDDEDWVENGLWFENFDEFFSKLVRVNDGPHYEPCRQSESRAVTHSGPLPSNPDSFWRYYSLWRAGRAADHGADGATWSAAEKRLGVALPQTIKPYLRAVNGGQPHFNLLPELPGKTEQEEGLEPFPGGQLLGVHQWVSLKELSDRLEFKFGIQLGLSFGATAASLSSYLELLIQL